METTKRRNNFVQSVDRAITVMELLSRRGWSGVTEVAKELEINKSTAYRLLTTLRDRGLVEQDAATEKYRLGFGLVALASSVTGGPGRRALLPARSAIGSPNGRGRRSPSPYWRGTTLLSSTRAIRDLRP
jgi:predicted transcriptional regulator